MDENSQDRFRALIAARLVSLDSEDQRGAEGQETVQLDQQSVGRLSRMDALQNQAMAKAGSARRAAERRRLAQALARIDAGEFGYCAECGDEIARARLEFDPAAPLCISCARG